MAKTTRAAAGFAGMGLTALALQALAAPSASADVSGIDRTCENLTCSVTINTTGADALAPVTVSIDGAVVGTRTPSSSSTSGQVLVDWTALAPGVVTVTATQDTSTVSVPMALCRNSGLRSATFCGTIANAIDQGSTSGSAGLNMLAIALFPIFASNGS